MLSGIMFGFDPRNHTAEVGIVAPQRDAWCDVIIPREDAGRVKPDPDHLLAAVEAMRVPLAESLLVGDHPIDIQRAKGQAASAQAS